MDEKVQTAASRLMSVKTPSKKREQKRGNENCHGRRGQTPWPIGNLTHMVRRFPVRAQASSGLGESLRR